MPIPNLFDAIEIHEVGACSPCHPSPLKVPGGASGGQGHFPRHRGHDTSLAQGRAGYGPDQFECVKDSTPPPGRNIVNMVTIVGIFLQP